MRDSDHDLLQVAATMVIQASGVTWERGWEEGNMLPSGLTPPIISYGTNNLAANMNHL